MLSGCSLDQVNKQRGLRCSSSLIRLNGYTDADRTSAFVFEAQHHGSTAFANDHELVLLCDDVIARSHSTQSQKFGVGSDDLTFFIRP